MPANTSDFTMQKITEMNLTLPSTACLFACLFNNLHRTRNGQKIILTRKANAQFASGMMKTMLKPVLVLLNNAVTRLSKRVKLTEMQTCADIKIWQRGFDNLNR